MELKLKPHPSELYPDLPLNKPILQVTLADLIDVILTETTIPLPGTLPELEALAVKVIEQVDLVDLLSTYVYDATGIPPF